MNFDTDSSKGIGYDIYSSTSSIYDKLNVSNSKKAQLEVTKLPVNNSNIPAVKTPVMVLYEKVGNGNVQFSPAVAVSGGFRITVGRQDSRMNKFKSW